MRQLEVHLRGRHVGRIMESRKGARFAYDEHIAGNPDPQAVTGEMLVAEAESWGVVRDAAEKLLEETLKGLDAGLSEAAKRFPEAAARHEEGARTRMRGLSL